MKQKDLFRHIKSRTKIQWMFSLTRKSVASSKKYKVFHSKFFICTVFPKDSDAFSPISVLWTLSTKKMNASQRNEKKRQWRHVLFDVARKISYEHLSQGIDVIFFIKFCQNRICYQDKKRAFQKTWNDILSYLGTLE